MRKANHFSPLPMCAPMYSVKKNCQVLVKLYQSTKFCSCKCHWLQERRVVSVPLYNLYMFSWQLGVTKIRDLTEARPIFCSASAMSKNWQALEMHFYVPFLYSSEVFRVPYTFTNITFDIP